MSHLSRIFLLDFPIYLTYGILIRRQLESPQKQNISIDESSLHEIFVLYTGSKVNTEDVTFSIPKMF